MKLYDNRIPLNKLYTVAHRTVEHSKGKEKKVCQYAANVQLGRMSKCSWSTKRLLIGCALKFLQVHLTDNIRKPNRLFLSLMLTNQMCVRARIDEWRSAAYTTVSNVSSIYKTVNAQSRTSACSTSPSSCATPTDNVHPRDAIARTLYNRPASDHRDHFSACAEMRVETNGHAKH